MPETAGNTTFSSIKVPENPLEIIALVPDGWTLDNSRLKYCGVLPNCGELIIEPYKKDEGVMSNWYGFPISNILQGLQEVPKAIRFEGGNNPNFLRNVRDILIPQFLSKDYRVDSFTASKNLFGIAGHPLATLHFYIDGLSKKIGGVANYEDERGREDFERFRPYFID
jgi:hypothetical protein